MRAQLSQTDVKAIVSQQNCLSILVFSAIVLYCIIIPTVSTRDTNYNYLLYFILGGEREKAMKRERERKIPFPLSCFNGLMTGADEFFPR